MLAATAWVLTLTTEADAGARENNAIMKACLEQYGYTPEKFETFNFSRPAKCHSDWRIAQNEKSYAKMREFLDKHPWYKGTNWKWEERAEYTCTKRYDLNGIVVCHKPYYLN